MISIDIATVIGVICFVIGITTCRLARLVLNRSHYSGAIDFDISTNDHKASFVFYEPIENFEDYKYITLKVIRHC